MVLDGAYRWKWILKTPKPNACGGRVGLAATMSLRVLGLIAVVVGASNAAEFTTKGLTADEVASGYQFTEGPATDGMGGIWFTDIDSAHIHRFDIASGETALMIEDSGGANGLLFDRQGRLLAAEGFEQQLTRRDGDQVEILADGWNGQRLNSPNDMVIDSAGATAPE